jgi:hypothetical protein
MPFSKHEMYLLMQGNRLLLDESTKCRSAMVKNLVPGDNNIQLIVEYYDKRIAALTQLQNKLSGLVSNEGLANGN